MNIYEWICDHELPACEERLARLKKVGAPEIMIEGQDRVVESLKNRTIAIGGDKTLLSEPVEKFKIKKGRLGKQYVVFNGKIHYFPYAKYGRFITV